MKKNFLRIGLIGCGRVAEHYKKKVFNKKFFKEARLVSVCDKSIIKSKDYAKSLKVKAFKDFRDPKFYKNIDLVFILTSSGSHFEIAKFLLKKKINVLCEKPLTMTPEKTLFLDKLSKKNHVMCGVVFQNRFNKSIQFLKELVEKKKFGKIVSVSIKLLWCRYQNYYNDEWHGKWKDDGGVINQQAIHHVDVMRWLFGPIKSVCAVSSNRLNKLQAEDTMHVLVKFLSGFNGTIEATTATRPLDLEASITVLGEKGRIVISGIALNQIKDFKMKSLNTKLSKIKKKYDEKVQNGYGNNHLFLINETIRRLKKNIINPVVSCHEALMTTRLIHSIYYSCENKKWIKLSENKKSKNLGKNN